jgi:S1-C subfamily serine protease
MIDSQAERRLSDVDVPCAGNPLGVCVADFEEVFGVSGHDIDARNTGLVVTGVQTAGPSYGKILADHDIITHVNDVRVLTHRDLEAALADAHAGDIVYVQTYRFHADETGFARIRVR